MTKILVKGDVYTVATKTECTVTSANGTPLGKATAGNPLSFTAATDRVELSDPDAEFAHVNPKCAPVAAGNSSGGNAAEELRLELLGGSFDDVLHWTDASVDATHVLTYMEPGLMAGFEEPTMLDGNIVALRLPKRNKKSGGWDGVEGVVNYCLASSYDAQGSLISTVRSDFVVSVEEAYVEFMTPLLVVADGKVKFEFGGVFYGDDYGVGQAPAFEAGMFTGGYIVQKDGARLLSGVSGGMPGSVLPEVADHTLYRTIYYKKTGAVDEKIAAHADNAAAHVTADEHAGLSELLARKDELLALLN